jgi:hypothetical protein
MQIGEPFPHSCSMSTNDYILLYIYTTGETVCGCSNYMSVYSNYMSMYTVVVIGLSHVNSMHICCDTLLPSDVVLHVAISGTDCLSHE